MIIANGICAICWLIGAIIAIVAPKEDYRVSYIVAAFCLALTYALHSWAIWLKDYRKTKAEVKKE